MAGPCSTNAAPPGHSRSKTNGLTTPSHGIRPTANRMLDSASPIAWQPRRRLTPSSRRHHHEGRPIAELRLSFCRQTARIISPDQEAKNAASIDRLTPQRPTADLSARLARLGCVISSLPRSCPRTQENMHSLGVARRQTPRYLSPLVGGGATGATRSSNPVTFRRCSSKSSGLCSCSRVMPLARRFSK